jgi:hypothetical protein
MTIYRKEIITHIDSFIVEINNLNAETLASEYVKY